MKNKFLKITAMVLALFACVSVLAACGNTNETDKSDGELKFSEGLIRSELLNSDGELDGDLTIKSGTSDNVLAFNYVVTGINAEKLLDKSFTKNATQTLLSNPGGLTYGQLKVCNAFNATVSVVGIFYGDENFNSNDFIDEILNIICDGSAKTYENWTISTSVDQASDSITIEAMHN